MIGVESIALLHYSITKKQFNMNYLLNQKVLILALLKITVHHNIIQKGDGENYHLQDLLLKFFTGFSRLFNATYIKTHTSWKEFSIIKTRKQNYKKKSSC